MKTVPMLISFAMVSLWAAVLAIGEVSFPTHGAAVVLVYLGFALITAILVCDVLGRRAHKSAQN